jgi:hypothetical protein
MCALDRFSVVVVVRLWGRKHAAARAIIEREIDSDSGIFRLCEGPTMSISCLLAVRCPYQISKQSFGIFLAGARSNI